MGMGNGKLDFRQSSFTAAVESGVIADQTAHVAMGTSYRPIYELKVAESRVPGGNVEETAAEEPVLPRMNVSSKAKLFEKLVEEQNEKAKQTRRFLPKKKMERAHTYHIDSRPEIVQNISHPEIQPEIHPEKSRVQPVHLDVSVLDEFMKESTETTVGDADNSSKTYAPVIKATEEKRNLVTSRWEPIQAAQEPTIRPQPQIQPQPQLQHHPTPSVPPVKPIDTAQDAMEDERTKLSLAEKTKFFEQKMTERPAPPELQKGPRRIRRYNARYQTQPITLVSLSVLNG